jgi:hypothetical protein
MMLAHSGKHCAANGAVTLTGCAGSPAMTGFPIKAGSYLPKIKGHADNSLLEHVRPSNGMNGISISVSVLKKSF